MRIFTYISIAVLVLTVVPLTFAENAAKDQSIKATAEPLDREAMSKGHRQMADIHSKMADCLASTLPISECRQQMSTNCTSMQDMMSKGKGMYGMMGRGAMGHGRMGHGGIGHEMMGGLGGCPWMGDGAKAASRTDEPGKSQAKK